MYYHMMSFVWLMQLINMSWRMASTDKEGQKKLLVLSGFVDKFICSVCRYEGHTTLETCLWMKYITFYHTCHLHVNCKYQLYFDCRVSDIWSLLSQVHVSSHCAQYESSIYMRTYSINTIFKTYHQSCDNASKYSIIEGLLSGENE